MHPFGNVVVKLELPGKVLLAALTHAVSALPATAGRFPQVSGLKFDVDIHDTPPRVTIVLVNGQPLDPDRTYTLALPDYLFTGGDGFAMLAGSQGAGQPGRGRTGGRGRRALRLVQEKRRAPGRGAHHRSSGR